MEEEAVGEVEGEAVAVEVAVAAVVEAEVDLAVEVALGAPGLQGKMQSNAYQPFSPPPG